MAAAEYHSRDFEWDDLRAEVENDPLFSYHLVGSLLSSSSSSPSPAALPRDADAWRSFHRRHSSGNFFKERRYLLKEFPELVSFDGSAKVLEMGCGNGSSVLPILRAKGNAVVYACDCSPDILERAKEMIAAVDELSSEHRFHPFLLDFSVNQFPKWLFCDTCQNASRREFNFSPGDEEKLIALDDSHFQKEARCCIGGVDFITLIFTLSAMPLEKMPFVLAECLYVLKPGSLLLFRDYGLYDMTMLRFPLEQKVGDRQYMRLDGTLTYFFSLETVRDLFVSAGFIELELEYCCVRSVNRQNGKKMHRVWIHGKFEKPK